MTSERELNSVRIVDWYHQDRIEAEAKKIREDRGRSYGSFEAGLKALAQVWGAMLARYYGSTPTPRPLGDLPPHLVALMHAAEKILRASYGPEDFNPDHYLDARNYLDFAATLHSMEKRHG